jgi:hypothetical protein
VSRACFFRYAWIAPSALEDLLPERGKLTRFAQILTCGRTLADGLPARALCSGAIQRLSRFARKPRIANLPTRGLLRSAARWARVNGQFEAAELVEWCGTLLNLVESCHGTASDTSFLSGLASTDFPVLLLWSNARLARQIFVPTDSGVAIAPSVLADSKLSRKVVTTCLFYILGTFGRFGPRDAWIGAGFATTDGAEEPAAIEQSDEVIRIEPDIGWMGRHWFGGKVEPIEAGEDAWSHVRRCRRAQEAGADLEAKLELLQQSVDAITGRHWSFADVNAFLSKTETILAQSVSELAWQSDPHRWWLSRVLTRQLRLRPSVEHDCERLYEVSRRRWLRQGLSDDAILACARTEPLPLRVIRAVPSGLIGYGEEFMDWVLKANAVRHGSRAFLPRDVAIPCAIVLHVEGDQGRYRLHEPNVLRTAVGIGRHVDGHVNYLESDPDVATIAPPADLVDQRLLRKSSAEIPVDQIPNGTDAMFRSTLAGPEVRLQITRELASPRYDCAPDLLPTIYDDDVAEEASFGRLDATNGTFVLSVDDARALAARLGDPGMVAAFYWMEINEALGRPRWVGALVDGKMSRFPVASSTVFRWLLHACRTSKRPIILSAKTHSALCPVLCDKEDRSLATELYVALTDSHKQRTRGLLADEGAGGTD